MKTDKVAKTFVRHSVAFGLALRMIVFASYAPVLAAAPQSKSLSNQVAVSQVFSPEAFLQATNLEREKVGLSDLTLNAELNAAALAKAEDMKTRGYFAHFYEGETPWDFITAAGYDYHFAGENLAEGYQTVDGITYAWMHSEHHRENILDVNYTDIGFACISSTNAQGQTVLLTVQMFGSK